MFSYTDSDTNIESSLVYEAYFDAPQGRLALVLNNGYAYEYREVPQSLFNSLVNPGESAGNIYNTKIKNKFNGRSIGYTGWESGFFRPVSPVRSVTPVNPVNENLTVGTPKGLTYAEDAKISTGSTFNYVNLVQPAAEASSKRSHEVVFEVDGLGNSRRTFNVEANNVDEAVAELHKATQALGLDVKVREVTVYFE